MTATYDVLVSHAVKTTWCAPNQDNQVIIQPSRMTPDRGVWNVFNWEWLDLELPERLTRFHLYQLENLHPTMLSLFSAEQQWVKFSDACNTQSMLVDVYVDSGVQLPRIETWYYVTREKALIMAVKRNDAINFDFDADAVYLRVYDNAYFQSLRGAPDANLVKVLGARITTTQQLLDLQTQYDTYKVMPGGCYVFVNGYKRQNVSLITAGIGDVVEFVYDSSIKRVIDWPIATLPSFTSTVDSKNKYLLHYAGTDDDTIDYFDDVDMFIVSASTQKGVYVHKNAADTIRMLSHRDYAVTANYINAYFSHFINASSGTWNLADLYLRMHVRRGGLDGRALVREGHRIDELYKLPDVSIVNAMLGIDSTVSVWRAASLEASKYTAIMQANANDITNDMARDAYGYHAVATLVADTPQQLDAQRSCELPYRLQFDSTVYQYDSNGHLITWGYHSSGPTYIAGSSQAVMVEALAGKGGDGVEEYYDVRTIELDANLSYRHYIQWYDNGELTGVWEDVTGDDSYYTSTPTTLQWVSDARFVTLTRSDAKHFVRRYSVTAEQGVISLKIQMRQSRYGQDGFWPLEVPLGDVDVFMNGPSLIPGLDYYLEKDTLFIVSKKHLINDGAGAQDVVVRMSGFCTQDLKLQMASEFGYIQNGRISVNQRFDIHDGKVLRIIAGGSLYMRSELNFSETDQTYNFIDQSNGQPYLIRDIVVPMSGLVNADTYEYRALSLDVDQEISDYMTLKIPQDVNEPINPIPERYTLYSPFFSHLIWACQNNFIDAADVTDHYGDDKVRALCSPYEYLLAFDPVQVDNQHNPDYVIVHPNYRTQEVSLGLPHYRFLQKAVRLYGNGLIQLSSFITMA